jgi:hypothetical protein
MVLLSYLVPIPFDLELVSMALSGHIVTLNFHYPVLAVRVSI